MRLLQFEEPWGQKGIEVVVVEHWQNRAEEGQEDSLNTSNVGNQLKARVDLSIDWELVEVHFYAYIHYLRFLRIVLASWYRLEVKKIIFFKHSNIISIDEQILGLKLSLGHVQGERSIYLGVNVKPLHTTVKDNGRFIVFSSIEANLIR